MQKYLRKSAMFLLCTVILIPSSFGVARKLKGRPARDSGRVVVIGSSATAYQAYRVKGEVYFSKATDGGITFGAKAKVNDSALFPIGNDRIYLRIDTEEILVSWVLSRNQPESTFGAVIYGITNGDVNFTLVRFLGEKRPVPRETTHTTTGGIFSPVQDAEANPSPPPDHPVEAPRPDYHPKMPPDILGDLDGDILTTPMDVAYLANNIFFGRPFPSHTIRLRNKALNPPDLNCDGTISPADVVVLLHGVFLGSNLSCP